MTRAHLNGIIDTCVSSRGDPLPPNGVLVDCKPYLGSVRAPHIEKDRPGRLRPDGATNTWTPSA